MTEDGNSISDDLKQKLIDSFTAPGKLGSKEVAAISVIYSKEISGAYKEGDRCEDLYGPGFYEEKLLDITFRVSPFAFF